MNTDFIKGVVVPILTVIDEQEMIDEAKMRKEVAALRQNCDYLIVSMHWGQEYQNTQNSTHFEDFTLVKIRNELNIDNTITCLAEITEVTIFVTVTCTHYNTRSTRLTQ